jgi:3-oxoacyl-[acyl-carrier-protein] synthase-3
MPVPLLWKRLSEIGLLLPFREMSSHIRGPDSRLAFLDRRPVSMSLITGSLATITAWGSHTPATVVSNHQLAPHGSMSADWIVARSGIHARCVAQDGENTSDLAAEAGRKALASAGLHADELDALLCATSTPDYLVPHFAAIVQGLIGARNAFAIDVGATFSGFVYALAQADALVRVGRARKVLVIGAETLTRIVDRSDRNSGFLFGDGAAAAVVEASQEPGLLGPFVLGSDTCQPELISIAGPSHRPSTSNDGAAPHSMLTISGSQLFRTAVRVLVHSVEETLASTNSQLADFDWIVPHQANLRIIECVARRLGLPMDRFLISLDRYGNTGAASIPLTIANAIATGTVLNGDRLLMLSCGGGLVWGSACLEVRQPALQLPQALPRISTETAVLARAPSTGGLQHGQ